MKNLSKTLISCLVLLIATTSTKQLSACTSQAGIMSTDTLHVCAFDAVSSVMLNDASGNPTYTLDANDGINYTLHTASDSILGTVISINATGQFVFQPGTMSYGQVYYISPVIGNNIGPFSNPIVDLTDMCLSVGAGTPVIWYEYPTADAGINMDVCGLNVQLDATIPTIGTGQWTAITTSGVNWIGSINSNNPALNIPNFYTNATGCIINTEYVFRWTVSNGPCQVYDDVHVMFRPEPVANAGENFSVCGFATNLNANFTQCDYAFSSGLWSGGDNTFANLSSPNTSTVVYTNGIHTFSWTVSNGQCTSTDYVTVDFVEPQLPNAGLNDSVCGLTVQLDADIISSGSGQWTCLNAAGVNWVGSDTIPNATVIVPNFDTNAAGCLINTDYTFRWTVSDEPCVLHDDVVITFMPQPIADAGTDFSVCGLETATNASFSLCGNSISSGIWGGAASFANEFDPVTTVMVFTQGLYTFSWTESNGPCTSTDYVSVHFTTTPEPNAGLNDSICGTAYALSAQVNQVDGLWTGPADAVFSDTSDPLSTVEIIIQPGSSERLVDFIWTETCGVNSASDTVNITFFAPPSAFAGFQDTVYSTTVQLNGSNPYTNAYWSGPINISFSDPNSPNSLAEVVTFPPNQTEFNATLIWTVYNGCCHDFDEVEILFIDTLTGIPMLKLPSVELQQNIPNPASYETYINYSLPYASSITLEIYDLLGNKIQVLQSGYKQKGSHSFKFNTSNIDSGTYLYVLKTTNEKSVKKMIIID